MKVFVLSLFVFVSFISVGQKREIEKVRMLYFEKWIGECGAEALTDYLSDITHKNDALFRVYKGAAIATTANCEFLPWKKLKNFNEGRHYLESAVRDEPENLEVRFIRFTIQTNIPAFLGYDNINEDKTFILKQLNLQTINKANKDLTERIYHYLKHSQALSEAEKKQLDFNIAKG
ncbi:MAG: hypothetical protein K9G76_03865 [Bacteroidales bacterium]|nr:hypothetical protein [Bacteroidales bacterium]MCF8402932.1 hypothetical protein [Bacteroidales bacterium]